MTMEHSGTLREVGISIYYVPRRVSSFAVVRSLEMLEVRSLETRTIILRFRSVLYCLPRPA